MVFREKSISDKNLNFLINFGKKFEKNAKIREFLRKNLKMKNYRIVEQEMETEEPIEEPEEPMEETPEVPSAQEPVQEPEPEEGERAPSESEGARVRSESEAILCLFVNK